MPLFEYVRIHGPSQQARLDCLLPLEHMDNNSPELIQIFSSWLISTMHEVTRRVAKSNSSVEVTWGLG